jgi:hypothetical protein
MDTAVQCLLGRGTARQVAWIPSALAMPNKHLRLKCDDVWEDGWQVLRAGSIALSYAYLRDRSQDYRHTRQASDI